MASQRKRGGDPAVTGGTTSEFGYQKPKGHWGSRLAPYAPEWAGGLTLWPVAAGAHLWFASAEAMPWASSGLTLLGAGLTGLTYYCSRARAALVRQFATATVGVTAAWTTAATIAGPWQTPLLELWAFGGGGVAVAWSIHKALKRGGDSDEGSANTTSDLFDKVKLSGVKPGKMEVQPNKVTGPLQLPAGEVDVSDVQKASDKIAAMLGLRKGAVRITENPDDASKATMTVVAEDVLKDPQQWPGPSHPGESILNPLELGVYENAEVVRLWLPGDKSTSRNATHVQVNGMNGSGKSGGFKLAATEILTRRDVVLIVLDPSKGDQTVSFLQDSKAHLVTEAGRCKKLLKKLPQVITDRASQLGQWGMDQWEPAAFDQHGMPYVVLWIEEASKLLKDVDQFDTIAQEARSAGISLVISQQKSSFRQMSTDVRSQLGAALCFGVKSAEDAGFSLSDETLDAGARPEQWQNRRPGCLYLEGPGIDEELFATPARTYLHSDEALAADIAEHTPDAAVLEPATAKTLGLPVHPHHENHSSEHNTTEQEGGTVVSLHSPSRTAEPADHDSVETDLEQLDQLEDHDEDEADEDVIALPEPHEPELEVDPDAELPSEINTTALPQPRPSLAEARANLHDWIGRQTTVFGPKDVPTELHGRERSWASRELARLADDGVITPADETGSYHPYPDDEQHAA
ncbi:plasmid transfer protein TraB [Actinopolyspora halophila]|uniref:plasmid transfer protein TraB n=1 Tax=Actinopolyspora halophila TaxID=1850 RepID=UPI00037F8E5D|nr:plasmid transfer protein TraB [Actinopolyspora halophila]